MKPLWMASVAFVVLIVIGVVWKKGVNQTEVIKSGAKMTDISPPPAAHLATPRVDNVNGASNRANVDEVRRIVEAGNVSINFWGTVIDQDGLPLSGVRVTYAYSIDHGNDEGVAWIQEEIRRGEVASGTDGSFAILGLRGHDLTIESLTKADYSHKMRFNHSYNFYGDAPSGRFISNQDKPITFAMISKDRLEPLIQSQGTLHVNGDGTPEYWNLLSGESDPSGELAVSFRANLGASATPAQAVNWSADLKIVGGGISEAPWGEQVRRAPESGYSATVVYPKVDQKQGVPHRSFYVKTADGKYGRLEVELSPSRDGRTARCFITSDMNPRPGSRNLESTEEE